MIEVAGSLTHPHDTRVFLVLPDSVSGNCPRVSISAAAPGPRLRQEDFNSKGGVMKKLFAVVMAVLTSLGLACAFWAYTFHALAGGGGRDQADH